MDDREEDEHAEEKIMWRQRQRLEGWDHNPRSAGNHQKLEEPRNQFFLDGQCMALLTPWSWSMTLMLEFWFKELWQSKFLLFKSTKFVVICYSCCRKQIKREMHSFMTIICCWSCSKCSGLGNIWYKLSVLPSISRVWKM